MKQTIISAILISCLSLSSCKDSVVSVGNANPNDVIMPLVMGNTWTYTNTLFSTDGTKFVFLDTLKITDSTTFKGEKLYGVNGISYFVNRSNGLYNIFPGATNFALLAKYPAAKNEIIGTASIITTIETSPDPITASANIIVASTAELVSVPAGTFFCYKYNADYYEDISNKLVWRENTYYSPNVGKIKMEIFRFDSVSTSLVPNEIILLTKAILH